MIANIIVLLLQILIPNSIIALTDETNLISYYEDNISGLFEYGGTHIVCLFTIFIVIYNISFVDNIKSRNSKMFIRLMTAIMVLLSLFIASNSDNKAFFILFGIVLFLYWYSGDLSISKRILFILFLLIVLPVALYFIYHTSTDIKEFVDSVLLARSLGNKVIGSSERIAIVIVALQRESTWLLGTGFGSTFMYGAGYLGFVHFGQADFSTILALGGIWYLLILFVYYLKGFYVIIDCKHLKGSATLKVSVGIILVLISLYTKNFTRTNIALTLLLIMLVFRKKSLNASFVRQNQISKSSICIR